MDRRAFLRGSAAAAVGITLGSDEIFGRVRQGREGRVRVAFVISDSANVIDLAGPWEVFQDVVLSGGQGPRVPFQLYTVSDSTQPVTATGGLRIVPHYTLRDAPPPHIVCVGAQRGSATIHAWLREQAARADLVMSVCTGAFQLASAGLLDGKRATTHHEFWDRFEERFPRVRLVRGPRFVADGKVLSAGGLTSGIDLALHVVSRYFGAEAAERTATYMEHQSPLWREGSVT